MAKYDYLIVGAGLFGAVFAYEAGKRGKSCLVIDKRPHIARQHLHRAGGGYKRSQVWRTYIPHI